MRNKNCLICGNSEFILAFPFRTSFNNKTFNYKKCLKCKFIKIDPNPDENDLAKLYDNKLYHEKFYSTLVTDEYHLSAKYLNNFLNKKIRLLDYGCGNGHFIQEINKDHECYGVEYDLETVEECRKKLSHSNILQTKDIDNKKFDNFFDVVHLGDVLEHVVNPDELLNKLHSKLEKNGLLYIEGPVERNFSIVNISVILFGNIKKLIKSNLKNTFPPYHLYFCNFKNQLEMINKNKKYKIIKYEVYETGWPYNSGNFIKILIAKLAIFFSKINIFGFKIGNRFRIILKKI